MKKKGGTTAPPHGRSIFQLYLEHRSLLPVVQEIEKRGWTNKRWQTRKGAERGGAAITRTNLYRLLTNVVYAGKVRYKNEIHPGEHPAVIDPDIFQRVQDLLRRNGCTGGANVRNQFGAVLKGLLRCVPCDSAMTPSHTTKGSKRYRYYTCINAQKRGWHTCPSKSIPANAIESLVLERIRCVGRDPDLLRETLSQAHMQEDQRLTESEAERRTLERDLCRWHAEVQQLSAEVGEANGDRSAVYRLALRIYLPEAYRLPLGGRLDIDLSLLRETAHLTPNARSWLAVSPTGGAPRLELRHWRYRSPLSRLSSRPPGLFRPEPAPQKLPKPEAQRGRPSLYAC